MGFSDMHRQLRAGEQRYAVATDEPCALFAKDLISTQTYYLNYRYFTEAQLEMQAKNRS